MTPKTNKEFFLAKAAGEYSGDLPNPITREEQYLAKIAQGGGSGDSYTKAETDALLAGKADVEDLTTQDASGDVYIGEDLLIKTLTQEQYEALDPPSDNVFYFIPETTPQVSQSVSPSIQTVAQPIVEPTEEQGDEEPQDGDMR